jgi:tetratricopeptide (TPR) repeat protein
MKRIRIQLAIALLALAACATIAPRARAANDAVTVTERDVTIPTYLAGDPEPNPIFYFGRASQGAQGRVYPYPLYDSLTNEKVDKTYKLIYLENEFVRIGILPEIGGRLFEAVDKTNNYDFIYHQHVIKPALIGLIGAWMSGGIEWNIPHHHRATTFLPVQSKVEENADGSKTVWVGELELRTRMRWAVGYTLYPGKSYLECKVRIINRTPFANTMLCFANVAVHANDNYQVIFPPSTQFVTFHGKREFTTWPIAATRFNGVDFSAGVDVSWYKNHHNAMSMFAWNYTDDFFGGYDHGREAGIVSVADHEIVPGKKFWTWGNGSRGQMWDKILTDNDGPYIELMAGAYSDNQPDYSWLQPYETKTFTMNWYPIRDIGGFKNANLDAAMNLDIGDGSATVGFCTTAEHSNAKVRLESDAKTLIDQEISIGPSKPFISKADLNGVDKSHLRASLVVDGKELIAYSPIINKPVPMPEPVVPPPAPKDIKTVEELYLAGQRIEQFHAPAIEPEPYWEEALRRDPGDSRVNTVLGIRKLKQAKFAEAEQHFRTAIKRLTTNYTSPKDGEPFYYLGLALAGQDKTDEAVDAYSKATWSQAWRGPAYFALAELASCRGDYSNALDDVNRSLDANDQNVQAINLKAGLLRHFGREKEAVEDLDAGEKVDPLDVQLLIERANSGEKNTPISEILPRYRNAMMLFTWAHEQPATLLEAEVECAKAGLFEYAVKLVDGMKELAETRPEWQRVISPLAYYYAAHLAEKFDHPEKAMEYRRFAGKVPPDYVFPFQSELIPALRSAIAANPKDSRAPYYLGNLLFDWQPEEAVKLWERSAEIDPTFAIAHRNLATAYAHQKPTPDIPKAIAELEKAVACEKKYALHFTELDELYASAGKSPDERLALLEANHDIVKKRDDALSHEIGLKVFAGKYDEAIALMTGRKFSVWEGGTLDVADHWVNAHILRGREHLAAGRAADAIADFESAKSIPDNLPSDRRLGGPRTIELAYWIGMANDAQGKSAEAKKSWEEAAEFVAPAQPGPRRFQGGPSMDREVQNYYQTLAKANLDQKDESQKMLHAIVDAANRAQTRSTESTDNAEPPADRPQQFSPRNRTAAAHYAAGLGHLGLGETDQARKEFEQALQSAPDNLGAHVELSLLQSAAAKKTAGVQ